MATNCNATLVNGPLAISATGPRSVIVLADPPVWSESTSYEYLTLVTTEDFGQGYISKRDVPSGTPLSDTAYWVQVGSFNAQLADLQKKYGELSAALSELANRLSSTPTFNTVADMASATLTSGLFVQTLGYHSAGDGGGCLYSVGSGTADGFTNIQCGSLVASAVFGQSINVLQCGAYGDGTHDDTAALNHAMTLGVNVILPYSKGYRITSPVNVGEAMAYRHIIGEGYWQINNFDCGVVADTSTGFAAFNVTASGVHFKGFTIQGATNQTVNGTAIDTSSSLVDQDVIVDTMSIKYFNVGINHSNRGLYVTNSTFTRTLNAIRLQWNGSDAETGNASMRAIRIVNNRFHSSAGPCILAQSGSCVGMMVDGNYFDVGTTLLIKAEEGSSPKDWSIVNNVVNDQSGTFFIDFESEVNGVLISGNMFNLGGSGQPIYLAKGGSSVAINGNVFNGLLSDLILSMGEINGIAVVGNMIQSAITTARAILGMTNNVDALTMVGNSATGSTSQLSYLRGGAGSLVVSNSAIMSNVQLTTPVAGTPIGSFNNTKKDWE